MSASDHLSPGQFFHGSLHDFKEGDLVEPGHLPPGGPSPYSRPLQHVYASASEDVARNYARRYQGTTLVHGAIYHVEPTGPIEPDDMEDGSVRSAHPMRVVRRL